MDDVSLYFSIKRNNLYVFFFFFFYPPSSGHLGGWGWGHLSRLNFKLHSLAQWAAKTKRV